MQVILAFDNIHRCNDLNNPNINTIVERGLKFFWNVIDFDHNGILSYVKIKYFYDEIKREMVSMYRTSLPGCDIVVSEIYDMLGYTHDSNLADKKQALEEMGPTWDFIRKSPQAKTVLLMLLDIDCFYRYEFRESLASSPEPQEDSPSEVHKQSSTEPQKTSSTYLNDEESDEEDDRHEIKKQLNTTQRIKPSLDFKNLDFSNQNEPDYDDDYDF